MQSASPFRAWRRQLSLGISCAALLCALAAPVAAKDSDADKPPTLVQADRLSYNQDTKIVTATGHVEVSQGDQVLRADKITYDQTRDVVHAQGHVAVMQPSGDVLFADQAELTSDMKQGFVDKVSILFTDDSRLAARDARRYEGRYLIADHGLYTACSLCREHPERAPLWQIKAVRITHDNVKKDVIYRDAIIEMGGVPVLYTPYFAHPDPTVTRRQGFMSPSGGYNETLGLFARVPYYFDIAPNSDAVFMPIFSDKDRLQLGGEFRHRFTQGSMRWSGSFTRANLMDEFGVDQGQQWRGHLFGDTLFDLNNTWRAGTKVAFTSDKSYLLRYNISNDDVLTNRAFVEGFQGRHYVVGNMYYFQDLRPGNQLTEPFVAPDVRFSALGEPGKTWGGRWSMNAGLLMMSRDNTVYPAYQGPDTRRLALDGGWERQFVSSTGLLTSLSGIVRMDSYMADNVPDPDAPAGTRFSKITTLRPFAQTDMTARYPLGRRGDGYQQIVEPIAVLSVAPQSNAGQRLPNEDSLDVEFDETNLFAPNRFTGIDRLEGGTRVAYGLRHALMGDNGARIEALGGQVFRLAQNHNFPGDSGLRNQFSDYVGRLDAKPGKWFDLSYGLRIDRDSLKFRHQELQASGGVDAFRPYISYLSANQTPVTTSIEENIEEIWGGFSSKFAKYWTLRFTHNRALAPDPGPRLTQVGISYQDECFELGLTGQTDHTTRLDVKSGTTVMFHFYLKNIGGLHTDGVDSGSFTPNLYQAPAISGSSSSRR